MSGKAESQSKFLPTTDLADIKAEVTAIEEKLDDATHGLASIKSEVTAIEGKLDHKFHGLVSIKYEIMAIEWKLDDAASVLASIKSEIQAIEAKLDDPDTGLVKIKSEIEDLETKLDSPANFMADVSGLAPANEYDTQLSTTERASASALSTVDANVDTLITRVPAEVTQRAKSSFKVSKPYYIIGTEANKRRITVTSTAGNKQIRGGIEFFSINFIPSGVTIDYVHILPFAQVVENTNATANKINGLQYIQVQKVVAGVWTNCVRIYNDSVIIPASTRDMGRLLGEPIDCKSEVDKNADYYLQWTDARVDVDSMYFDDIFFIVEVGFH